MTVCSISVILSLIGLWSLYSISPSVIFYKQLLFLILAIVIMYGLSGIHYAKLKRISYVAYFLLIATLFLLLVLAKPVRGVKAWIYVGSFTIQPSEFMKIGLILVLARFVSSNKKIKLKNYLELVSLAALPVFMIALQPDLGMTIVFVFSFFIMLLESRVRLTWVLLTFLLLCISAPVIFYFFLKDYQKERIMTYLYPSKASMHSKYQQNQAVSLTASGCLLGKGIGEASSSGPYYVPERHNDFIFSVIGEELGFLGTLIVIGLFGLFFLNCLHIASFTRDIYGRTIVIGSMSMIFIQVAVNIGTTLGLLPVAGITLPFLSYGGSSLFSCFVMAGLIASVARHRVVVLSDRSLPECSYSVKMARN